MSRFAGFKAATCPFFDLVPVDGLRLDPIDAVLQYAVEVVAAH
jgi:hypothetical protein